MATAKIMSNGRDSAEWGHELGLELCWTQEERGIEGRRVWTAAHGRVWSRPPRPDRILASIYVRDGMYAISSFGLYGLDDAERESLERHLEDTLKLARRDAR
jgi:hypothetical protein